MVAWFEAFAELIMGNLVEGRVAAGRGIGREHAIMLASHGDKVVVNGLGGATIAMCKRRDWWSIPRFSDSAQS